MATWQRLREPLAVTLLAALAGLLVVRAIELALTGLAGPMGFSGPDDMLLIAAVSAGLWCTKSPASPHARPIVIAGCVLVGLTIASWLVIGAVGLGQLSRWAGGNASTDPQGSYGGDSIGSVLLALGLAEGLLRLVLPIAALVALVIAQRGLAAAAADADEYAAVSVAADVGSNGSEGSVDSGGSVGVEDLPDSDRANLEQSAVGGSELRTSPTAATWQPSDAAGAVWLTADDAAQGAPATGWGAETNPSDRPSWIAPTAGSPEVRSGGVSYGWSAPAGSDVVPGGVSYGETVPGVPEVTPGGVSRELPPSADDDDDLH